MRRRIPGWFTEITLSFIPRTIKSDLMLVLILTALLPTIIINFFYYSKMTSFIDEKIKTYNIELINQVAGKLNSLLNQTELNMKQLVAILVASDIYENYDNLTAEQKIQIVSKMDEYLRSIKRYSPHISEVYYFESNGNFYSSNRDRNIELLKGKEWVKRIESIKDKDLTVPTHLADYSLITRSDHNPYPLVVSFIKKLELLNTSRNIGILQVDVRFNEIDSIIRSANIGDDAFILVLDSEDNIIYCPDDKFLGGNINEFEYIGFNAKNTANFVRVSDESKAFIADYSLAAGGWRVVGVVSTRNLYSQLEEVKNISLIITILSIVFLSFMSYLISKGITSPINKIIKTMRNVGEGKFEIVAAETRNKDLQVLTSSFNIMVNEINHLMKNIIEKEKEKQNAEIKALQAQINPHFQYNTLNTIKWMAYRDKNDEIANAILALIKILEFSAQKSDNIIPISDEMKFVQNYVFLQKMRFGDNIVIYYEIDDEIYDYCILKFTLQPIVENAIIHGLGDKNFSGSIFIKGIVKGDLIEFEVIDDGVGMDTNSKEKFTGIGIGNVDMRIRLNFGDAYGLKIFSSPGEGTRVRITLPKIKNGEVDKGA